MDGFGFVEDSGAGVKGGEVRFECVEGVVDKKLGAVGADVKGFERRDGGGGVGRVGGRRMGPVAVSERGENGGKGPRVSSQVLESGHGNGCESEGGAVSREGGHGGDGAALVFKELRE